MRVDKCNGILHSYSGDIARINLNDKRMDRQKASKEKSTKIIFYL